LELLVSDPGLAQQAELFFKRTTAALDYAAAHAPSGYVKLRKDVRSIVLTDDTTGVPYNRFQLAILVPGRVALEADAPAYAAWLLHVSGLSRDRHEAAERASAIESTLDPALRDQLQSLLPRTDEKAEDHARPGRGGQNDA
jgi:hypothetical protein